MASDNEEAERLRQNQRKLQEHLERIRASGGKPGPTPPQDKATEERSFKSDWEKWKKSFTDRVIEREEGPLIPPESADYQLLGVKLGTPFPEVRKAFHKLAFKHHPDQGGDIEKFRQLMEAFDRIERAQPK